MLDEANRTELLTQLAALQTLPIAKRFGTLIPGGGSFEDLNTNTISIIYSIATLRNYQKRTQIAGKSEIYEMYPSIDWRVIPEDDDNAKKRAYQGKAKFANDMRAGILDMYRNEIATPRRNGYANMPMAMYPGVVLTPKTKAEDPEFDLCMKRMFKSDFQYDQERSWKIEKTPVMETILGRIAYEVLAKLK